MEVETWLSPEFWTGVLRGAVEWALQAGPRILILWLGLLLVLKLIKTGMRHLQDHIVKRYEDDDADLQALEAEKRVETLIGIVRTVTVVASWVMFLMLVLVEIGINVGPLIAGAGVLGLAVGFGAQELVRDVISGFFILLENHLRAGDVAVINGQGGRVERIGLRTIQLRDLSGVVHVFQNGKVDTLANMTKEWSAMVFDIGVAYKEDCDHVIEVMEQVSEELRQDPTLGPKILEPMEVFGLEEFGDSAVVIRARLKTAPIEQWTVGREYRKRLKRAFDARGIEIPFPHRTLYWGEQTPAIRLESASESGASQRTALESAG